jgi:hypothetical protein
MEYKWDKKRGLLFLRENAAEIKKAVLYSQVKKYENAWCQEET